MASVYKWLFLVCILCISKFGLYFCSIIMMAAFFGIAGFVIMLVTGRNSQIILPSKPLTYQKKYRSKLKHAGIPKIMQIVQHSSQKTGFDKRLTGSVIVDEPLQEIINNIFHDFILSWYNIFSSDEEFLWCIKELFKNIINNVSRSIIEVDWISFFTKHIVDDFASHLRLFRKSEMALKNTQKKQLEKNIESIFFDMELTMEKTICRDIVCTSDVHEKKYLLHLVDMLLYLLLPFEDFKNISFRFFLRDVLVTTVFHPMLCLFADPDYINQNIIWLCKDYPLGSKHFLTVIRRTDSLDELSAVKEIAKHELKVQKSKDTRDKAEMNQYIKSITFVHDLANQRFQKLVNHCPDNDIDYIDISMDIEWKTMLDSGTEAKFISLPFDIVLNNNVGLHYFTEFMSSINAQGYVFFYHNIEGFRTTAESLLSKDGQESSTEEGKVEKLREFAMQIFDAYLGENAAVRVKLDENLLAKLHSRMKTENINETFYDSVQSKVYDIMLNEFYTTSFKVSPQYIKLLAELELLPDFSNKDDESLSSKSDEVEREIDASLSSTDQDIVITELIGNELPNSEFFFPSAPSLDNVKEHQAKGILIAEIYNTGITHHAGKTFAVYAIAVSHHLCEGPEERWFVVRRYSEFHEFHKVICEKYPELSNIEFPSKKAFNNLSRHLMEKRRHVLNEYLQFLLLPDILNTCSGLQFMLYNFLEPRVCEKEKKSFVRTVGTLVSPIKTSVKTVGSAVKLVPTTLFNLKDGLVRALSRTSSHISLESNNVETDKVSAGLDLDAEDIPVRIILLLLDEIFDLKSKDLWFRRRIIALMRQIIKTTQGDTINRKNNILSLKIKLQFHPTRKSKSMTPRCVTCVPALHNTPMVNIKWKLKNYVDGMTSANQVAEWLKQFSQTFWPNGILAQPQQERDNNTKLRTRVAAKSLLLSSIPDELKHIIGSETSCKGTMTIFHLFQNFTLNRRLVYVLLEHFLVVLFPQNNIAKLLELLHCESPRITPVIPISEEHFGEQAPKNISDKNSSSKGYSSTLNTSLKSKYKSQANLIKQDLDHHKNKRRHSLSYIDGQDSDMLQSKSTQKKEKSVETAVFYTDIADDNMYVCSDNFIS